MRSLAFEGSEGKERFDILYGAMLVNPEGYARETRRVCRRILEKLERISKPSEDQTGLVKFEFGGPDAVLQFEEAEFKLVVDTVDSIRWTRASIVLADRVMEWLETIEQER